MKKLTIVFALFFSSAIICTDYANAEFNLDTPEKDNVNASFMAEDTASHLKFQLYGTNKKIAVLGGRELYFKGKWGQYQTFAKDYVPKYLYDAGIAFSAFSQKDSISIYADSKSDNPYNSLKETDIGLNYYRTIEKWSSGQGTWLFVLNYSSRRGFWDNIPIPFVTYRYVSEKFVFMIPFLAQYNFSSQWSVYAQWVPLYLYKAGISWKPGKKFELEMQNGVLADFFYLAGREQEDETLYMKRSYLKLIPKWKISDSAELSGNLGWIFRSSFYHGDGYRDENDKIRTGGGAEFMGNLKIYF